MRLSLRALIASLALALAASPAAGAQGLRLGFNGDATLTGGSAAARAQWVARAASEGADIVRVDVTWSQVAPRIRPRDFNPTDPASPGYNWSATDAAVRALTGRGIAVLLNLSLAPSWAEGPHRPRYAQPGTWRPSASAFAAFATAAARRYDGRFPDPLNPGADLPRVRYWQAWNEPNLDYYLSPQWQHTRHGWAPVAPVIYRSLLNAFYAAVKRISPGNLVVAAGTAPYGDPPGADPPGQERTPPVAFDRTLFCLRNDPGLTPSSCPDPPHLDVLAHHPYGIGGPLWHALNPDDVAVPDLGKLSRVLHAAERDGHALPRGPKQLWVTEISWDSKPPDPQAVPIQRQARWLEQSLYVLWRQGVDTVLWLQLLDSPCIPNCATTYQAGVLFLNGAPKPAATAFRFPFVTSRLSRSEIRAWGRAPVGGRLAIQIRTGRRWHTVRTLSVGRRQVFTTAVALRGPATLRAQLAGQTSLTWSQGS